jgi:hypothetical protein
MTFKALTFSPKYLSENFEPYILETIKETTRIAGNLMTRFDLFAETLPIDIMTVTNLLQAMTFGIHP